MSQEKLDLAWNDFESNAINMIRNLLNDTQFADVTLISDDRRRIKAHKIILNSCSPFFKQVLAETSNEKPILFIKGIDYSELSAIVGYIYLGRTEIAEDNLGKFMKAAKELEIDCLQERVIDCLQERVNGDDLFDFNTIDNNPQISTSYSMDIETPVTNRKDLYDDKECKIGNSQQNITPYHGAKNAPNVVAFQNLDFEKQADGKYSCGKCTYQSLILSNVKMHILSLHEGVRFICPQCDRDCSTKSNLRQHMRSKHEGKKYPCRECGIEFSYSSHLNKHRTKTHKEPIYCDM